MKVLIQLIFNSGLGNLYCGVTELLNFASECKTMGYCCELLFASNCSSDNKYIGYVDFGEIFDVTSFTVFDKITSIRDSVKEKCYNEYIFSSGFHVTEPGQHWWDIFLTDECLLLPRRPHYDIDTLCNGKVVPKLLPKFSLSIAERVAKAKETIPNIKKCIQVRHNDFNIHVGDEFKDYTNSIIEICKNTSDEFYVSSNNQFFLDSMKKLNNIVTFDFDHLNVFPNDFSYYPHNRWVSRELLVNRLCDNICEMILLSEFDIIFHHTSLSWNSTFLYYSLSHNNNQILINITWADNLKNLS